MFDKSKVNWVRYKTWGVGNDISTSSPTLLKTGDGLSAD